MQTIIAFLALIASHSSYNTEHVNRQHIYCMSVAVYHEARGEDITGRAAVAHVIQNRIKSRRYPNNACAVVYQPRQFTFVHSLDTPQSGKDWLNAVESAIYTTLGITDDPTNGALHYYAHDKVNPIWAKNGVKIILNNHTFIKGIK